MLSSGHLTGVLQGPVKEVLLGIIIGKLGKFMIIFSARLGLSTVCSTARPNSIIGFSILHTELSLMEEALHLILILGVLSSLLLWIVDEGPSTKTVWIMSFRIRLAMIDTKFDLMEQGLSSMKSEFATWLIERRSAASPPFWPQPLLATEFKSSRMMAALLLGVSVTLKFLHASPIRANHFQVLLLNCLANGWLLLYIFRQITRMIMLFFEGRRPLVQLLHLLLFKSHLIRVPI